MRTRTKRARNGLDWELETQQEWELELDWEREWKSRTRLNQQLGLEL